MIDLDAIEREYADALLVPKHGFQLRKVLAVANLVPTLVAEIRRLREVTTKVKVILATVPDERRR